MKFTKRQHELLAWMQRHGGVGHMHGFHVVVKDERSSQMSAASFLHLIAHGAIKGINGNLVVTEYGRRVLGLQPINIETTFDEKANNVPNAPGLLMRVKHFLLQSSRPPCIATVQRTFHIGWNRSAQLFEKLREDGVLEKIGETNGIPHYQVVGATHDR